MIIEFKIYELFNINKNKEGNKIIDKLLNINDFVIISNGSVNDDVRYYYYVFSHKGDKYSVMSHTFVTKKTDDESLPYTSYDFYFNDKRLEVSRKKVIKLFYKIHYDYEKFKNEIDKYNL